VSVEISPLLHNHSARLSERLGLYDRDCSGPRASARGLCDVCGRAGGGVTVGVGALEFPSYFEWVKTTANIGRDEVEAVRCQRARNEAEIALWVRHLAIFDLVEDIRAQLLETFIINDAIRG